MLLITTYNAGMRSARDLFWTFLFRAFRWRSSVQSVSRLPVCSTGGADERHRERLRVVPDIEGRVRIVTRLGYLHPGTRQPYGFRIYVPREMDSFDVIVLVSAADTPYLHCDLAVTVDASS